MASCWSQDPERRDAILSWCWQRLDRGDRVIDEVAQPGMRLHVFAPDEVERAVARAGLATVAVAPVGGAGAVVLSRALST
jgi:hypothetical protein